MKRLLCRLVAISLSLSVVASNAQTITSFATSSGTNAVAGASRVQAQLAPPLPVSAATLSDENVQAASSNAVGLVQSAQRISGVPGGGRAEFGLLKVYFPADAAGEERFRVTTPDSRTLAFQPRFLAWYDTSTGERWLLAQVTNRVGLIVPSGQVLYTNAFDSIHADLRYRYGRLRLEQDVVVRERLPLPEGALADNLRLEIWTEWFDSTPASREPRMIDLRKGITLDGTAPTHAADEQADFISAKIGDGYAFSTGEPDIRIPVSKMWARVDQRDWLIETVDYTALKVKLDALSGAGGKRTAKAGSSQEELIRALAQYRGAPTSDPASSLIETAQRAKPEASAPSLLLALADLPETPGVVVDFAILACVPVPPGVISWWPAGGNGQDAISGNHGTLHNSASFAAGKVGQGFNLPAYDEYSQTGGDGLVRLPDAANLRLTSALTIEAWIYPTALGDYGSIVAKWGAVAGYNERAYVLALYPDGCCYLLVSPNGTDAGATYVLSANAVPLDEWTHVVGTYDGTALRVYLNGVLEAEGAYSGGVYPGTHELGIGAVIGGAPAGYGISLFSGAIDEAAIYDRALSSSEIGMIYEAGAAGKINPNCVSVPADVAAWLPADTHPYDVHTGKPATLQNGAGYTPAVASHGFTLDGVNDGVAMTDADAAALDFGAGQDFSVEVWLKADQITNPYGVMSVLGKRYTPNSYTALGWELFLINGQPGLQIADATGPANFIPSGAIWNTGWRHVVVTVNRDSTTGVRFHVDGVQLAQQFDPTTKSGDLANNAPLRLGVHPQSGLNCYYKGVIDEATVYRRALSGTEASALYQAGSAGKSKADVDNDGMEDWWEMRYFGNLDRIGTGDFDNDGLTDLEEFQLKTDPTAVELQVSAYKSPCEDEVYVEVTNLSGRDIKGGSFDLFIHLNGSERTHYRVLQPWGPLEVLPDGEKRIFTFCTPDEWITDFDCRVIHQSATVGHASLKFRIAIREELARIYKNTTQVVNLSSGNPACENWPPSPIFPPPSRRSCDEKFRIEGQPCGPWPAPPCFPAAPNPDGGNPLLDNFYKSSEPPEHVDLSCPKKGFKNVYAIKQWHGRWGYNSLEWDRTTAFARADECFAAAIQNTPDTTKYRTLSATATIDDRDEFSPQYGGAIVYSQATSTRSASVGRLTGKSDYSASDTGMTTLYSDAHALLSKANGNRSMLMGHYTAAIRILTGAQSPGTITYTGSGGQWTARYTYYAYDPAWEVLYLQDEELVTVNLSAGTYRRDWWLRKSLDENGEEADNALHTGYETITLGATTLTYRFHDRIDVEFDGSATRIKNRLVDAELSDPYTSDMVNEDTDVLLATWNLLDDTEYPWRTDGGTSRGPLVTRNELGPTPPSVDFNLVNVGTPEEPNWQPEPDDSTLPWPSQPPGAILGAPLPVHVNGELRTYEAYFNFYHPNWHFEDSDVGFPEAFLKSRGAFSPYPNATQWVDDNMARVLPGGPFWGYGSAHGTDKFTFWFKNPYLTDTDGEWEHGGIGASLIKCKWAETIDEPDPEHGKDFVFKDWKFNFRDFAESYHACIQNYYLGTLGCPSPSGCNPVRFTPIAENYPMGNIIDPDRGSYWISDLTTTPLNYDYHCCRPVVLVQPTPPPGPDCNGLFVQMPPAVCDERYGSLWMGRVDQSTSDVNSCPNYVANRNAGIANPVDCDPQIELNLNWHPFYDAHGIPVSGRYEIFVAPLSFGYGGGPSPHLDLDIDSDNNNAFDPPDRNGLEDWLEDIWTKPGKKLDVNDDDSDGDGIPDFADGFNWGPDLADGASPNDRFVPLVLELPEDVNLSTAWLNLTYSAADPTAVTFDAISSTWHPGYGGHLRIWKSDANQPRNKNSAKAAGNPGDYVEPGIYDDLSVLGLSGGNRLVTLYVEGILPSYSPGDQRISVELDPDGPGPEGWTFNDAVRVTVLAFELDIDSDNNNGFDRPARDQAERAIKAMQVQALPDEERVRYPGKILMVNDGDVDGDGVPDFADNLELFEADGVRLQGEEWPECPRFVPMVLQLGSPSTYASMKVRFTYSASNPADVQKTADGDEYTYAPAPGHLRIWTRDGATKRKVAAANDNGHYVAPEVEYSPADLGFNHFTHSVTLYVEAVDVSADIADLEIKVEAGWDDGSGGPVQYLLTDFVRVTALNLSLMNVDEANYVTKARHIETSLATPVVTVNSVSVSQVQPSGDAQYIVGTLNLAGSIASAIQDITPISANQNISEVLVYLNDSEDPIRIGAATYSKTANPNSFLHPFPYAGTFSGSVPNVTLLEGVNVIRVVAKDPVDDGEGFAEFCFEVQGISPAAQGAGIVASLDVELAASLSATSVDTITATLTVPGTGSVVDETLTETAADSRVFANAGGTFQIQITTSGETLDPAQVDEIYAVAIETTLGVTELAFPFMQETGDDTKLFHKDLYWSDEDADDYAGFVFALSHVSPLTASDGGVFKPFLMQVRGPDLFMQYLEEIVLDDGPRRIEQSPIDGKYYVRMKNSPSVVLQFNGKHADSGEPNANAMLSYLGDSTSCLWAFTRGFGAGGWSMVEGTWGLLQFGVDMSVWYSPQMITWRLSIGDTFETEKRFISTTAKTVKQVGEMVQQIQQDQDDIMVALLSGNWQEAADISLAYRLGMEYTGELLVALAQETWNLPLKEQCFYTGRATFEIAGLAVAWAKAGKLSQFGKLEFLNELRAVPFFATGRGAGAFTRIEQLLTRLVGATACFPPGTQIETRNGPKPIETIVPGDYVLSRCPETGLTDYRRVNRVFANRAPYLVHVTYRPRETRGEPPPVKDGLSSSDDEDACAGWRTIAATPEHPFYAHNRKEFVRAAELQPGDVFTSSEDRAFEVVGTEREQAPNVTAFTVHNFEVDAFHTYFVGDDRLWVHNACGGKFHSVYSLYLRYVQKQGKTPEEAFKLVEGFRKIARHNIKDGDIGRVLDEVLRTDTFPGVQTPLWTKGKYGHPGENMWKHYLDHVVDNKSNFPGREFPNIDNAVDYIKAARGFVDNFGTGSDWKRWTRVRNGVSEEVFVRKSTREFSPVIRSGTENGASKTYFRVHPTEDLRDYAIRNDYDEAVNGPW